MPDVPSRNWAGNVEFRAARRHQPADLDELRRIIASSHACRVVGSGHSFNTIADTPGDLVSLARLPRRLDIDGVDRTVTVSAGVRYGELAVALHAAGLALPNTGSLPHISVAGACSTGTHGSGDANRCLADAVERIEIVTSTGDVATISADDPDFAGAVVALGTLGAVTAMTLRTEPTYDVAQSVWLDLPFDRFAAHLDEVFAAGYSVSPFTTWRGDSIDQVWVKRRTDRPEGDNDGDIDLAALGARPADRRVHPVIEVSADACTEQLGIVGPWHERLPHFRLDFTPSTGDELQTEYFVDRRHAPAAVEAVRAIADVVAAPLLVCELRTIAGDDQWLSMCSGRDSLALHFSWKPDRAAAGVAVSALEQALAPFEPRPHWGKVFDLDPATVTSRYPMIGAATALANRYDPGGTFRNDFTAQFLPR
jgi:xylitol oxidase